MFRPRIHNTWEKLWKIVQVEIWLHSKLGDEMAQSTCSGACSPSRVGASGSSWGIQILLGWKERNKKKIHKIADNWERLVRVSHGELIAITFEFSFTSMRLMKGGGNGTKSTRFCSGSRVDMTRDARERGRKREMIIRTGGERSALDWLLLAIAADSLAENGD